MPFSQTTSVTKGKKEEEEGKIEGGCEDVVGGASACSAARNKRIRLVACSSSGLLTMAWAAARQRNDKKKNRFPPPPLPAPYCRDASVCVYTRAIRRGSVCSLFLFGHHPEAATTLYTTRGRAPLGLFLSLPADWRANLLSLSLSRLVALLEPQQRQHSVFSCLPAATPDGCFSFSPAQLPLQLPHSLHALTCLFCFDKYFDGDLNARHIRQVKKNWKK